MSDAEAAEPRRALVIMAHPDDIEFTCGGTVAQLSDDGWQVSFCLVTSGDKGTKDPVLGPADLGTLREAEQEAAAAELGVHRCIFLRVPDGHVEDGSEFRGQIVQVLRDVRPELMITWDGYRGFNHRDHRTVGIAALDAVFPLSRNANSYAHQVAAGSEPVSVNTVLLAGSNDPNYFVDVSAQLDRRIDALLRHASQVQAANRDDLVERMRNRAAQAARAGRLPWTEGFRRLTFGNVSQPRRAEALKAEAKARRKSENAEEAEGTENTRNAARAQAQSNG